MSNNLILNYHDAVLYQSDLAILKSPSAWLNDACIHFYFTRLQHQIESPATACRFIDPSVLSFFMHQWDEEEDGDEDVLGLKQQQKSSSNLAVFLPINDNYVSQQWSTPGGGTHWSLLLLVVSFNDDQNDNNASTSCPFTVSFWHLDSSAGNNRRAATAVAQKIQRVMAQWRSTATSISQDDLFNNSQKLLQECSVPQQQNGYDCGLHTLAMAEVLAKNAFSSSAAQDQIFQTAYFEEIVKESVATSPSYFQNMRQKMVKDIETLAATTPTS